MERTPQQIPHRFRPYRCDVREAASEAVADLLRAVETTSNDIWPGVPVIPQLSAGATDGRFLNSVGIWTYGITGAFHYPCGSNAHGLNEKMSVTSLYDAHEFQYQLGKRLGG